MNTLLDKENRLFQATYKTIDAESFQITFRDYFSFLTSEGVSLVEHLSKESKPLLEEYDALELRFKTIKSMVAKETKRLDKMAHKLEVTNDPQIQEALHCLNTFLSGLFTGGDRFGSRDMDLADAIRKLYTLGHEKEAAAFLTVPLKSVDSIRIDNLSAFQGKKEYLEALEAYKKKCKTTIVGTYLRLVGLYSALIDVDKNNLNKDDIALAKIDSRDKYTAVARMCAVNLVWNLDLKQCIFDVERLHNEILSHNVKVETLVSDKIFTIKDSDIYHYQMKKLTYKKRAGKEPKYITLFKRIIDYMPSNKDGIRITAFEKLLPKVERIGKTYRANLGTSAKSFSKFLKDNGVKNINPNTGEKIIEVTDEYIYFRNKL
jgi:hypothetical protein